MSEKHRQHVMAHVAKNHTTPPSNPQRTIANSTRDALDEPTPEERELVKRRLVEKSKGKVKGAFNRLLDSLGNAMQGGDMSKSLPAAEPLRAETIRMNDFDQGAIIHSLKAGRVSTPKSMAKSLGLEAGYGTDSATLTGGDAMRAQSLDKRVQSTVVPIIVKKPTKEQLLAKGMKALKDGRITGAESMNYEYCVNMGRAVEPELMLKVNRGDK